MAKAKYGDQNGKEPSLTRLAALRRRREYMEQSSERPDYATATPGWIAAAIVAVTKAGGAIQFGYSRDGGIYTIVILLDGDIDKNYVKQSEGIDNFLEALYNDFTGGNEPINPK